MSNWRVVLETMVPWSFKPTNLRRYKFYPSMGCMQYHCNWPVFRISCVLGGEYLIDFLAAACSHCGRSWSLTSKLVYLSHVSWTTSHFGVLRRWRSCRRQWIYWSHTIFIVHSYGAVADSKQEGCWRRKIEDSNTSVAINKKNE